MIHRLFGLLPGICLIAVLLTVGALADGPTVYSNTEEDGTPYTYQDGSYYFITDADQGAEPTKTRLTPSAEDVICIATPEEFDWFRQYINGGSTGENATWKLTDDLSLSQERLQPVGNSQNPFSGAFDGNDCTISYTDIPKISYQDSYLGLFGRLSGATVSDLTVKNFSFSDSGSSYIGTIAGYAENSTVENCTMENSSIQGQKMAGGVVGCVKNSTVEECSVGNSKIICEEWNAGGIAGQSTGSKIVHCQVSNGTISAVAEIGGIVGAAKAGSTVTWCRIAETEVCGFTRVGGIAGEIDGADTAVTCCWTESGVNINHRSGSDPSSVGVVSGGVVGAALNNARIDTCYNLAAVAENTYLTGGICALGGVITNCFNAGVINGNFRHPICSASSASSIKDCYYDRDAWNGTVSSDGCTALTTEELQSGMNCFTGASQGNSGGHWSYRSGSYPTLSASIPEKPTVVFNVKTDLTYTGNAVTAGPEKENDICYTLKNIPANNKVAVTYAEATEGSGWVSLDAAPRDAGTYTVRVSCVPIEEDISTYATTYWEKEFTIARRTLTADDFKTAAFADDEFYTAQPIVKKIMLSDGLALVGDTDYTVSYKNNTHPSSNTDYATLTIAPKAGGSCVGSPLTFSYRILLPAAQVAAFRPSVAGVYTVGDPDGQETFQVPEDPTHYVSGIPVYFSGTET